VSLAPSLPGRSLEIGFHAASLIAQLARLKNTDGEIDSLGTLITAAFGIDTSWMAGGKCRGWNAENEIGPTPWQVNPQQMVDGVRGEEYIEIGLMVCFSCPAQYACANYAVEARMMAGTWAMHIGDLEWLRRQKDWEVILTAAELEELPVQRVVGETRRLRENLANAAKVS
jgi:hypothetical protein